MKYILLQVDPATFEKASPYGTAIYGLFVLALIAAAVYLAKEWASSRKDNKELTEKVIVLVTEVKEKVLDNEETKRQMSDLVRKVDDVLVYIKTHEK